MKTKISLLVQIIDKIAFISVYVIKINLSMIYDEDKIILLSIFINF